jgi:pyruvate dehydrogenase E2 component (dihydrolipoamide acetyltransferase)
MAIEIVMPKLGWTMEEGVLAEWIKHDGDTVAAGDVLFTVESDKALNEVESFENGILRIGPDSPAVGSTVPVGGRLAYIVRAGERAPFEEMALPEPIADSGGPAGINRAATGDGEGVSRRKISPRARRAADELGVDVNRVRGSGRGGRIVERDVRAAGRGESAAGSLPSRPSRGEPRLPVSADNAPSPATRRLIAERMMAGAHTTAPVTLTTEADATELVRLREQLRRDPAASALPLPSFSDLFVKLAAHALDEHPALNARLEGEAMVQASAAHIGLAVDTERGLLVPVVRDAGAKRLRQIAGETARLVERARAGRLSADEMRGGTFTLTNLGMYEIDAFTPILNLPECAILGLGRIVPKVVVVDAAAERTAIRHMQFLSLTFDHRLVDGAPAARFLQRIKQLVEQPYVWLVH